MKYTKMFILIVLLTVVFTSCAQQQPKSPKEVSILWSEIDQGVGLEIGDILEVVLPANPSTGHLWEAGFYNQSVLKPLGEAAFYRTGTDPEAGVSQKLHFEAIGEGETELVLVERQSIKNDVMGRRIFEVYIVVK